MDNRQASQSPSDQASFWHGNRYVFSYQNHSIELWTSNITGRETVILDGKVVSQKRSFRSISEHVLELDGRSLRVRLEVKSKLKGPVFCVLSERSATGEWSPVAAKKLVVWASQSSKKSKPAPDRRTRLVWWLQFGFSVGVGVTLSHFFGVWTLEFWAALLLIAVILLPLEHFYKRWKGAQSPDLHPDEDKVVIETISVDELSAEDVSI
ncbi:hypothetical protein [Aliidiomarina soli]|uniref:Uncharacterized protein n=1 Tax=Aliidiomarina soli TaxID=1928574 RepID=A0A432WI42_9GAMM|nr:hypothetical protein [Aliidiomarina soli]RUO33349.1 hypothetical protein CWE14_09055 [Aliidiomarina soli]